MLLSHGQAAGTCGAFKGGEESTDGCRLPGEEVEIARESVYVPVQYQGGSTRNSELFRLG